MSSDKADELVKKADKKLSSLGWFGGSNKYEDAADLLERAANQYKLGKNWQAAGATFVKLGDVHLKLNSKHEAAAANVEAAKAYNKVSPHDGVRCLQRAVELYTDIGRLGMAAKNLRDVGEAQEKAGQKEEAITFYEQAADLFAGEDQTSEANKCRLKVAQFSAELDRFPQAIQIFEDVAKACVENNLLKFSAKGYLLNAGICQLCTGDEVAIATALERYKDIDINFADSREDKLLQGLAEAASQGDVDKFTEALQEYDSMTRLDPWKTGLLLKAKKRLSAQLQQDEDDLT